MGKQGSGNRGQGIGIRDYEAGWRGKGLTGENRFDILNRELHT